LELIFWKGNADKLSGEGNGRKGFLKGEAKKEKGDPERAVRRHIWNPMRTIRFSMKPTRISASN
jgi:hypothetical protein